MNVCKVRETGFHLQQYKLLNHAGVALTGLAVLIIPLHSCDVETVNIRVLTLFNPNAFGDSLH